MKYFVANWKQYKTHQEAISWCTKNIPMIKNYTKKTSIIICPSFDALLPISKLLLNTNIKLGAQNCSEQKSGAYTGEVSAQSLYEIGCQYCIVGHSERYQLFNEQPENVAKKALLLLQANITPIICVNENNPEKQLATLTKHLKNTAPNKKIIIAYEPTWAIGTGKTPDNTSIENTITLFKDKLKKLTCSIEFLYGGSANAQNINVLSQLKNVDGFLVGKASTDSNQIKEMLNCLS